MTEDQDKILTQLRCMKKSKRGEEWLRTLYKSRIDRFLSDNERIWTTGRILIPLAVGAFGVYGAIGKPELIQTLVLAIMSVSLLCIWNVIADVHKHFQDEHTWWIRRIESVLELPEYNHPKSKRNLGQCRHGLFCLVAFAWLVILCCQYFQCLRYLSC